jgi:hypothetical protein
MPILTLSKLWINRLDNGQAVSAQSAGRGRSHDQAGDVRTYAGGRQRAVTIAGERGTFTFRLADVTLPTVELLRSWVGLDVQVRDHRGQRFFGVFFGVTVVEHKDPSLYEVAIVLRTVTVVEGA